MDVSILDANGDRLANYDQSKYGRFVHVTVVSRDLATLMTASVVPGELTVSGGGGGMMAAGPGAVSITCGDCEIQPKFTFPADGQYIVFTDFWPVGADQTLLKSSLRVGSAGMPVAKLAPDEAFQQQADGLQMNLQFTEPLSSGHYQYLTFEAVDGQGRNLADFIQRVSGSLVDLEIVDESLQTYLRPDFVNRHKLQYSVNFPRPGIYKLWFTFKYKNVNTVEYVVEVK